MKKSIPPKSATPTWLTSPVTAGATLVILTLVTFLPALHNDFMTTWDDGVYITGNEMIKSLSWNSFAAFFTTPVNGTWVPLPLLSFSIEYQLAGLNPFLFHLDNLLLHILVVLLVYRLFRVMKLDPLPSLLAAALFAIHPLRVESVAWITERKDLLYGLFYVSALLSYICYIRKTNGFKEVTERQGDKETEKQKETKKQRDKETKTKFVLSLCYSVTLLLFSISLLSKIQAVSFPLVLLVLDYYFERKLSWRLVAEKIPFFLLAVLVGLFGIHVLRGTGTLAINEVYGTGTRLLFGCYAFVSYLVKFIVPAGLSALYPFPAAPGKPLPFGVWVSPVIIAVLLALLVIFRQRSRGYITGFLFFTVTIVFLLQIFGAGTAYRSDRFSYIPHIGLCFAAGLLLQDPGVASNRTVHRGILLLSSFILLLSSYISHQRCAVWKNGETLWSDVIAKYPSSVSTPYTNRALYYRQMDKPEAALADYTSAWTLNKKDNSILLNRGNIWFQLKQFDSAMQDYRSLANRGFADARLFGNLGALWGQKGNMDSAVFYLDRAIALDTTQVKFYKNRSLALQKLGRYDEAIRDMRWAMKLDPGNEKIRATLEMQEDLKKGLGNRK
jgi:protein O-mannosyl-transferase